MDFFLLVLSCFNDILYKSSQIFTLFWKTFNKNPNSMLCELISYLVNILFSSVIKVELWNLVCSIFAHPAPSHTIMYRNKEVISFRCLFLVLLHVIYPEIGRRRLMSHAIGKNVDLFDLEFMPACRIEMTYIFYTLWLHCGVITIYWR